jgi:hypothetical protein
MKQTPHDEPGRSPICRWGIFLAAALTAVPLLGAGQALRGHPASRLAGTDGASEYWDLVALFRSNHKLFARFMITNEGPGKNTGIAYGHFVEPDGTTWSWSNGRREGNWKLLRNGRRLEVGSSELDMSVQPYTLRVHKKKKGVDIDLQFTPDGPAVWDAAENADRPFVDLLAKFAPMEGSVWFRGMPERVELSGRVGLTHTWMDRSESELSLRRVDFFSLTGEPVLYFRDFEAPDGTRSRWLVIARDGETLYQSNDFELTTSGRSSAQNDSEYPVPAALQIRGPAVNGEIRLGAGLVHHDPMEDIPQPFRFLLSLKMRPHRVWTDASFAVTLRTGPDRVRIRGSGIATVTFLNPIPPPRSRIPPLWSVVSANRCPEQPSCRAQ